MIHDKVRNFKVAYDKVLETVEVMKDYRKKKFLFEISLILTEDNKEFLPEFLDQTDKWPIDFHDILLGTCQMRCN